MIALDQRRLRPIPQPRPSFLLGNMLDVRAETRLQDLTRALTVVRELGGLPGPLQKLRVVKQQEVQGAIDRMNAVIDQIIADRKQKMQDATPKSDLLNAMLTGVDKQTGEGLSDENIRYQMITFLIAGHETTSSLLSWAIYFLLKNPEALARASEEVDRVLGRDYGAHPTFKQVQQLDYVAQVLKETLRLAAPSQAAAPTQVAQHHTPLLVLYGSNMGTSEAGAHYLGGDAEAKGFVATVVPLDDYVGKLPTEGAVVILTSSYNGGPPDNAVKFCDWLERGGLGADSLRGVNYTIFGCGNRDWASTYQRIPRLIDAKLESYGARRIYSHGEGDASEDLLNAFEDWYKPFWKNVAQALSLDVALPETADRKVLYDVEVVEEHPWHPLAAEFGPRL